MDAVVVGGGFGGIRIIHLLQSKLALASVVGIEEGDELGGTWYWNQYPGAQTDTESWVYRFSDDRDPPEWETRYLGAEKLQRQIVETARKTGVLKSYVLGNKVTSAIYDDDRKRWVVATDKGLIFSATYLVTALGILTRPNIPAFPGIDSFKGLSFHSARWPRGLDVKGKRIAIIGTGPSGSQITATIHPLVKQITVFQQRAQYIVPVNDRPVSDEEKRDIYANYDGIWDTVFSSLFAMGFKEAQKSALDATEAERHEVYQRVWDKGGGFRFFFETFGDLGTSLEANETAAQFVREKIAEIVKDPATAKLLQSKGPYGGRPLCTQGYYESFNQPNVSLVDISSNLIAEITPTGLKLADGTAFPDFDIIVYATGFDGVDGAFRSIDIRGRSGIKLADAWHEKSGPNSGATALYGVSVADFPNLFTVTGPGGPFANMLPSIELQGNFILGLIEESRKRAAAAAAATETVEADNTSQSSWAETVQGISRITVFDHVKSWIQNDNVAGKSKYSAFFLAGLKTYSEKLTEEAAKGYPSFVFEK